VIDTRRYQWAIGGFGVLLVILVSIYMLTSQGVGSAGVTPGQKLHFFSAPLATSSINGDANMKPPCTLAQHNPGALNTCLIAARTPLVLALFATGSDECKRSVDTLEAVSRQFPSSAVQFAAIAIKADRSETAKLVRSHGWTVPVAFDRDGAVGQVYGVEVCPLIELASRGGIVKERLIGNNWLAPAALAQRVRALIS
jgi:hypothetical protein